MIKFSLKCANHHGFESWFQSGAAFDSLRARGMVACPVCGQTDVAKALMAPAVSTTDTPAAPPVDLSERIKALRTEVEANSNYVGSDFATQARAMYLGDIPDRPIHGEARMDEAKALIDDGVPILPLPFVPSRKAN